MTLLKVAIIADMLEERWPSMELVAELVLLAVKSQVKLEVPMVTLTHGLLAILLRSLQAYGWV